MKITTSLKMMHIILQKNLPEVFHKLYHLRTCNVALNQAFSKIINRFIVALTNDFMATDYIQKSVSGSQQILKDLSQSSEVLKTLNSEEFFTAGYYDMNQFKISIHSDAKKNNQIFRMIGSSFFIDKISTAKVGLLTAEEAEIMDLGMIQAMADITAFYNERIAHYESEAKVFGFRYCKLTFAPIFEFSNLLGKYKLYSCKEKIQDYKDSKSYLNFNFEFNLKTYLGLHFKRK